MASQRTRMLAFRISSPLFGTQNLSRAIPPGHDGVLVTGASVKDSTLDMNVLVSHATYIGDED
jgi:hypothetical protein